MNASKLVLLSGVILLQACAHTTKGKLYQNMALSAGAGALIGQTHRDYPNTYSFSLASAAAALAAIITIHLDDPDREVKKIREEMALLKSVYSPEKLEKQVAGRPLVFGNEILESYKKMIVPGEYRIYSIDRWVPEGENRLVHQDKIVELIPPSLKAGGG